MVQVQNAILLNHIEKIIYEIIKEMKSTCINYPEWGFPGIKTKIQAFSSHMCW